MWQWNLRTNPSGCNPRSHRLSRSFRNLSQLVNRLSAEILTCIVRWVPREDDTDTRSIIPLTHVCRYWRDLIVSIPWVWTLISSNGSGDLAALSLQRAKAAPLELWLNSDQLRKKPGFSELIAPYAQNIGTLRFSGLGRIEEFRHTPPNFPQSVPNLRSLVLCAESKDGPWEHFADPFESLTPTLKYLELEWIPLYPSLLRLRTLTELTLRYYRSTLHLDTLLDFLEENRSLKRATQHITFGKPTLRSSQRRALIANQLQHLSVEADGSALVSNIALQRGAYLGVVSRRGLGDFLSGTPTAHLSNLSPVFMEYECGKRGKKSFRLLGPNGTFSFRGTDYRSPTFAELPLTNIRELHIRFQNQSSPPSNLFNPSSFPALEVLAVACDTWVLDLSTLFSCPSSPPPLKTLAFLNCYLSGDFMEELTQFASNREYTTSASLRRIVIIDSQGRFPTIALINVLRERVPVVDARIGNELPADLA